MPDLPKILEDKETLKARAREMYMEDVARQFDEDFGGLIDLCYDLAKENESLKAELAELKFRMEGLEK